MLRVLALTAHSVCAMNDGGFSRFNRQINGKTFCLRLKVKLSMIRGYCLHRLPELVAEILEEIGQGRSHWEKLFQRLGPFFKEKLGVLWEDIDQSKFPPTYY